MIDPVVPLASVRLIGAGNVGNKAASLGELIAAGERVPPGVVLTVAWAALPPVERDRRLAVALRTLGGGPFAVRSSGVAEDGDVHSFAGQYETILDVAPTDVPAAAERCLASGRSARARSYGALASPAGDTLAVIVQQMIKPTAAGVALTADPISGDRTTTVISAVRGLAERLVSGAALADEWIVRDGKAAARRRPERAITNRQAREISRAARRVATARGKPQDLEWAIDASGALWLLQARPMTALPPDVSWAPPVRGSFTRAMRFGEWISEPVTPLFESWLLTRMEERLHELQRTWIGVVSPRPLHIVLNGWYFYSLAFAPLPGGSLRRSFPGMLRRVLRSPRRVAVAFPPTARHGFPVYERDWRDDLQPRYRAAARDAGRIVGTVPAGALPALIDELATLAGEYFASLSVVAGSGYKVEMNLAAFYRQHLAPRIGGSHLDLLAGFDMPSDEGGGPAVETLDWARPPIPDGLPATANRHRDAIVEARRAAELAAVEALTRSPRQLRTFRRLLADAQHLVPIREEQARELTLPWPILRKAVERIGEELVAVGAIDAIDDVFFLTRDEVTAALAGSRGRLAEVASRRRTDWALSARLRPPLFTGRMARLTTLGFSLAARMLGAARSDRSLVSGVPASAGRATGPVRVIHAGHEFHLLEPGEILVAPLTTPGWTPLFGRAAAVVTDIGSALSHASIVAREFGIPAVVGCGDATARLVTGMRVTVDGSRGTVEPASPAPYADDALTLT